MKDMPAGYGRDYRLVHTGGGYKGRALKPQSRP